MKWHNVLTATLIFTAAAVTSLVAIAQVLKPEQVPSAVKQGFAAKFPTVKLADWKIKSDKNYEAEFTLKGTDIAAKFDSTGKWLETESAISRFKVPKAVRDISSKTFKGYKVVERQSLQRWNEESLIYELHLENAKEIVKAQFAVDGSILSQSTKAKPAKGW
jgi:curli biogenesis system outer membrane secretion channel CsgG